MAGRSHTLFIMMIFVHLVVDYQTDMIVNVSADRQLGNCPNKRNACCGDVESDWRQLDGWFVICWNDVIRLGLRCRRPGPSSRLTHSVPASRQHMPFPFGTSLEPPPHIDYNPNYWSIVKIMAETKQKKQNRKKLLKINLAKTNKSFYGAHVTTCNLIIHLVAPKPFRYHWLSMV